VQRDLNTEVTQVKEKQRVIALFEIASTFLQLGLVSYSLSALGEAKKILVEKKRWITDEASRPLSVIKWLA